MSSSVLRIIAVLLAMGALVLGYMGYQASQAPVTSGPDPVADVPPPEPVRLPVLVAARDIGTGQSLNEEDVTTIFVKKSPEGGYSEQKQVLNRQVRVPIAAGDFILRDHFYDFSNLVNAIRPGERAIAVRVDEVTGVGGFVQPGDYVDVFLFLAAGTETGKSSSAQRILSSARVLAYGNVVDNTDAAAIAEKAKVNAGNGTGGQQAGNDAATANDDESPEPTGKQSKTAVLAVQDKDLSALLLAESAGRLRLALLGPEALAALPHQDKQPAKAELAEAEKQQRQALTLEALKVEPQTAPVTRQRTAAPPPPAKPKVTIHRGVNSATVSVDREN